MQELKVQGLKNNQFKRRHLRRPWT